MTLLRALFATGIMVLAGCVAPLGSSVECESPTFGIVTGPLNLEDGITRQTDEPIPALVRLTNRATIGLDVALPDTPRRANAPSRLDLFDTTMLSGNTTLGSNETAFAIVEYRGGFRGEYPPFEIRATLSSAKDGPSTCVNTPSVAHVYTFVGAYVGEIVRPGHGAMVHTAGFWLNGTLFYTNIDRVHNDTSFERAGWYEFENGDPLPVYVYNSSREERPQRYNESGFVTTIPGFNEALKGMSVSGSRVANLRPEEAYTQPGNEEKELYGDAIVFYIEVRDVVAIDCALPEPACEPPTLPPAFRAEDAVGKESASRSPVAP